MNLKIAMAIKNSCKALSELSTKARTHREKIL